MKSSLERQYIKRYSLKRLDFLIKPNEMGHWEYMSVRLVILILMVGWELRLLIACAESVSIFMSYGLLMYCFNLI